MNLTPQQDIEQVMAVMAPGGFVRVREYVPGKFTYCSLEDRRLLVQLTGRPTFRDTEFDDVADSLGAYGFGIETQYLEDA